MCLNNLRIEKKKKNFFLSPKIYGIYALKNNSKYFPSSINLQSKRFKEI